LEFKRTNLTLKKGNRAAKPTLSSNIFPEKTVTLSKEKNINKPKPSIAHRKLKSFVNSEKNT
jgi:hypothetical protein